MKMTLGKQGVIGNSDDGETYVCELLSDGEDIYITVNGKKIAKRAKPGTPQAKTWIPLEPGWTVTGFETISINYDSPNTQ